MIASVLLWCNFFSTRSDLHLNCSHAVMFWVQQKHAKGIIFVSSRACLASVLQHADLANDNDGLESPCAAADNLMCRSPRGVCVCMPWNSEAGQNQNTVWYQYDIRHLTAPHQVLVVACLSLGWWYYVSALQTRILPTQYFILCLGLVHGGSLPFAQHSASGKGFNRCANLDIRRCTASAGATYIKYDITNKPVIDAM